MDALDPAAESEIGVEEMLPVVKMGALRTAANAVAFATVSWRFGNGGTGAAAGVTWGVPAVVVAWLVSFSCQWTDDLRLDGGEAKGSFGAESVAVDAELDDADAMGVPW